MKQLDFEKTEVFEYLQSLQIYAYGDLELFHKLAKEAELLEKNSASISQITSSLKAQDQGDLNIRASSDISADPYATGTSSSSTTPISTKMSHGSMCSPMPTSQKFRATIPFTMMMLSCMEMLGYLAKENGIAGKTEKNIRYFFSHVSLQISSSDIKFLVGTYRHGLAHNYFPKLNNAISYHSTNPMVGLFYNSPGSTSKTLDVNYLERCFVMGLEKIIRAEDLYGNLDKQYTTLKNSYLSGIRPQKKNWFEGIWKAICNYSPK